MKTGENLQMFLETRNLTVHRFEMECGLSISSASRVIQGKQEFSIANLERIYNRYPEINLDWLLTGRGKMLIEDEMKESIRDLERKIKLKREQELEIKLSRNALEQQLLILKDGIHHYSESETFD